MRHLTHSSSFIVEYDPVRNFQQTARATKALPLLIGSLAWHKDNCRSGWCSF